MPPTWLTEWLDKRQQTQEKKTKKPAPKLAAPAELPATGETAGSPPDLAELSEVEAAGNQHATPVVALKRLARMVAGTEELVGLARRPAARRPDRAR